MQREFVKSQQFFLEITYLIFHKSTKITFLFAKLFTQKQNFLNYSITIY